MTRAQIERLVRRYVKSYKRRLGLGRWTLYLGFSDDPCSDFARARCLQRPWEYRQASIEFYPVNMRNDSEEEIRTHVVHELLHVVVGEMREKGDKHEERVVCDLVDIILGLEATT